MSFPDKILSVDIKVPCNDQSSDEYRNACRAVIIDVHKILFTKLDTRQQYLTPGGGIDVGETYADCVVRECREELGIVVSPGAPVALISEYYGEFLRFRNLFVSCTIEALNVDQTHTDEERKLQLSGVWLDIATLLPFLASIRPHQATFEQKPLYIQKAIECSPLRESFGIAECLGWDLQSINAAFAHLPDVDVHIGYVNTLWACDLIRNYA